MSMNSPAKQERIERHLMRQRGAGVRTVSANFGFFFGSSQPPSKDATPSREEPPPKRQKTGLDTVVHATESINAVGKDGGRVSPVRKIKQAKSRKRWISEEQSEPVPSNAPVDEEDSFVVGIEAKRKDVKNKRKTNVSAKTEEQVEVVVPEPAAKGRPRRRAAATAAVKVADGFAEEAAPIDKKRRDAEGEPKVRKSRKKPDAASMLDSITPAETTPEQAEVPDSNVPVERRSKKRKANELAAEDSDKFGATADAPKKRGRKKAEAETVAVDTSDTPTISHPTRQPLKETNHNVAIRSTSPEKPSKTTPDQEASVSPAKIENKLKRPAPSENTSSRPAKRGKVKVRQDEKSEDASGVVEVQVPHKEDIDWMFEPQPRRGLSTIAQPLPARGAAQKLAKTRSKMPDIDLDDLLSDIASLAKKDIVAGAESRGVEGLATAKTSRGRRKKP